MDIENFWKDAPDVLLEVEPSWNEFIESTSGERVDLHLSKSPTFDNADYIFHNDGVVIELKEITTEFSKQPSFNEKYMTLIKKVMEKDKNWRPYFLGGDGTFPSWYYRDFIRIFRPPISRILKKANKQIKETKSFFNIKSQRGIIVIVNDGFNSLEPKFILGIITELLNHSYTSIDCIIYTTVNRYMEIEGTDEPKLIWVPFYSDRVDDEFHLFVDDLGRKWFDYLEQKIGFTSREESDEFNYLSSAKAIMLPSE